MFVIQIPAHTVYVIGGWDRVSPGLSTNDAYKVSQDEWTTDFLPMPTPRAEVGAAAHGRRIYILGVNAASLAMKSKGSRIAWLAPDRRS